MAYLKIGTVDPNYPAVSNPCNGDTVHVSSLFSLVGRTALITGGNGGIGGYMARGMAEAGADIIIFKIPGEQSTFPDELGKQTGRKVHVYECDLGDSEAIRAAVAKVLEDGLTVDILCNVAGISGEFVQVLDENDDHRGKVAQIHYHAPYVLSQLIGHHMASRQKGGKIINISSIAAFRPQTRFSTYGPMKAALSHLTETLATEFARYNIQVNDLVPGCVTDPSLFLDTESSTADAL
ncbi:uncharacterized protein Z520_12278 [Fonsecaea multimorphosa CBS 102226]|uniref:Uncharacterized protein n=1 Tax=Fonsecaea multimorphosa CBS 102226 TaxID=1442371 RepID=A0A0D2JFR0_9EURO|nr:uncharacterized protein Z520_12278 [Fonsecaea multimorphosa CBS 102226]KIX92007.1 hypothetical protein Z520_12278 [Fonsecaea multimorphosa CBS 102226]OAL17364.1 hypothetical protein AYO22_11731 [Fonsecaea multimorphosa]